MDVPHRKHRDACAESQGRKFTEPTLSASQSESLSWALVYQYDGRNELEPITIADNDVFVGTRLAFNDVQDTAVLAGFSYDTETGESFINIEAERRFGDNWFGELCVRILHGAEQDDATFWLQKDDYVQLSLARYF